MTDRTISSPSNESDEQDMSTYGTYSDLLDAMLMKVRDSIEPTVMSESIQPPTEAIEDGTTNIIKFINEDDLEDGQLDYAISVERRVQYRIKIIEMDPNSFPNHYRPLLEKLGITQKVKKEYNSTFGYLAFNSFVE